MSRFIKILISFAVVVISALVFSQTQIGKSMLDQPMGGTIQVFIAGICLLAILIGILFVLVLATEGNDKQVKNPVSIYRYESGVTIVDLGGRKSFKFKRNPATGDVDLIGEIYPDDNGIFVASIN